MASTIQIVNVEDQASLPPSAGTIIEDHGQVRYMTFPSNWTASDAITFQGGMGSRSWMEVRVDTNPEASVCFYYRGQPESQATGTNFRAILDRPPHMLKAVEIKSLSDVLRGKDNPELFSMICARTEDLNGRRVLIVEGRALKTQEDIYAIIVDADGSGRIVQEIYFQSPRALYPFFVREARQAFKSIQWKRNCGVSGLH